jgi:hypothetical protein
MSKSKELAIKQLRQAANNLFIESQDHSKTEVERDLYRAFRLLVEQTANAVAFGATYKLSGRAEEADKAHEVKEGTH